MAMAALCLPFCWVSVAFLIFLQFSPIQSLSPGIILDFFFQCFPLFDFVLPPLCFNPVSFSNVSLSFSSCWHDGVLHACVCFSLLFPVSSFSSSSSFLLLSAADTANIFNKHFSTVTARLRLPEMTICFFVLPPCDMAVLCSTEKEKRNHRGK